MIIKLSEQQIRVLDGYDKLKIHPVLKLLPGSGLAHEIDSFVLRILDNNFSEMEKSFIATRIGVSIITLADFIIFIELSNALLQGRVLLDLAGLGEKYKASPEELRDYRERVQRVIEGRVNPAWQLQVMRPGGEVPDIIHFFSK